MTQSPASMSPRAGTTVLGVFVDAVAASQAGDLVMRWCVARQSRVVCLCNVHSVVTATRDREFADVLDQADLAAPDGMPVAWMLRRLGYPRQERTSGPDLMWHVCALAAARGEAIFLYGATNETLRSLERTLLEAFPELRIAGSHSPPFRPATADEDREIVERINASGAGIVWVGLGCPKQERWMAAHRGRIHAVMVGVGAAFDYHAGSLRRAPRWMQDAGLEWFHRLCSEPRRLWRRYLVTNTLFILGALRQLAGRNRDSRQ